VLIGAESTGKTTLAQLLANRFNTTWVPEYGREHWERKVAGFTMNDALPGWSLEEFVHIAAEQQARENRLAREANRVLICDTNAFATGTWHERYYHYRDERVDAIGAADRVDLYLLTAPDVPFVQDGFRDGEGIRRWMHDTFENQLAKGRTPWRLIEGSYEERFGMAENAISALLGEMGRASGVPMRV
jgi:NadR type nicotinamide-nucleotide adenylyltransferase